MLGHPRGLADPSWWAIERMHGVAVQCAPLLSSPMAALKLHSRRLGHHFVSVVF